MIYIRCDLGIRHPVQEHSWWFGPCSLNYKFSTLLKRLFISLDSQESGWRMFWALVGFFLRPWAMQHSSRRLAQKMCELSTLWQGSMKTMPYSTAHPCIGKIGSSPSSHPECILWTYELLTLKVKIQNRQHVPELCYPNFRIFIFPVYSMVEKETNPPWDYQRGFFILNKFNLKHFKTHPGLMINNYYWFALKKLQK